MGQDSPTSEMQTSRLLSYSPNSPSFDSFSSAVDLAAIAAGVVQELRDQEQQFDFHRDDDNDFEFAFDCPSRRCSHPIATADEIFYNGKIRPSNPYGGGTGNAPVSPPTSTLPRRHRPALRKLMSEERDRTSDSSSEAEEDLTGVSPESYCVWTPKGGDDDLQELSLQSKIKSNKRWKMRNLLYVRSSSEGNGETNSDHREEEEEEPSSSVVGEKSEETKRQTFGPFNKDMMGILKNFNGLSRHLRPF
ncbi:hypothetical protein HID58_032167 [Brassica napus]|uniref:Uncharacterized protein n=2 Tax=Brassica napus TaxID=3708 RepID=A0ABQ8BVM7_BRANA|nr:hypothetical protein HID58_094270 [Brassica napus]KAH0908846.1 hypothetical protein HID58_032167 [Brassica napus]